MKYGRCVLCGKYGMMEEHHIFSGPNRKLSEKYGLKVLLCGDTCHRTGKRSAHVCPETAQALHEYGQKKFMLDQGATVEDFIAIFGRNYL